jgi:hypothetical protein
MACNTLEVLQAIFLRGFSGARYEAALADSLVGTF